MAKLWKILALLCAITLLVWLTTLWRWQSTHVDPGPIDLALNLALLPLVLTAALVGMLWSAKRLRSYAAAPVSLPASRHAAATAPTSPPTHDAGAERRHGTRVLAASAHVRAGSRWKEALAAMAEGDCKPGLDAQLRDDDGIAIFTAPMPDLSTESAADGIHTLATALAEGEPARWAGHEAPADMLRALTLLGEATAAMAEAVEPQWAALSVPPTRTRAGSAASAHLPTVSIRVGIPARWSRETQQLASAWIEQLFAPHVDAGLAAAGQSRAMAQGTHPAVQLHIHPSETAEAFWQLMEQQLQQWQRDASSGLLWVLAADSLVSEPAAERLAAGGDLFSGTNQRGRIPGEAAASLLLASAAWPMPAASAPALALLHAASIARRDKSADATGRITPQALTQAIDDTLHGLALEASAVQHLTTDCDHRPSRTGELYETVQARMPHLDAGEQALRLGLGCGDVGLARLLACAALAATQAQETESPGLVLGTSPAFDRLAALVTPAPPVPPPSAAAPAPAA
ncbi:MAG: hypothetical protein KF891_02320 [Rhizobacter sp.]|nr:hypothetical protein [Rhizobacter sp.]